MARRATSFQWARRALRTGVSAFALLSGALGSAQTWEEVGTGSASGGGVSANPTASEYACLALGSEGRPFLAWHDRGLRDVLVAGWTGATWERLGAGSVSPGGADDLLSCYPSLAVLAGAPVVAWVQESSVLTFALYVRHWGGSAWAELGAGSASGGGVSQTTGWPLYPALAALAGGRLVLAWQENSADDDEICVRQWTGSAWDELSTGSGIAGGISRSPGRATHPAVATGAGGTVVVAWIDDASGAREIYVRAWNGSAWMELGSSASGGGISASHGGISGQEPPALALTAAGRPLVAWTDSRSGNAEITVRGWDGSAWVPLGSGSASATAGASTRPALAITAAGTPLLAWQEQSGGPAQIMVRAWNGTAWADAGGGGAGSAISQTVGTSQRPALALDTAAQRAYVAWDSNVGGTNTEIFIRQWDAGALDAEPAVQWSLTVTGVAVQSLTFGFAAGAAEGLDDLDQPTPTGAGTAWFEVAATSLSRDLRPAVPLAEWRLVVAAAAADMSLAWPALAAGTPGRFLCLYELDDRGLPPGNSARDLASAGTLTVPAGVTRTYVLRYAPDLVIDLALRAGWNALSLPLEPSAGRVDSLTPLVPPDLDTPDRPEPARRVLGNGVAWTLTTAGLQPVTTLQALTGYWLYAPAAAVLLVRGLPPTRPTWNLHAGWNLVGTPADMPVPAHVALTAPVWGWDPRSQAYRPAPRLLRTGAFWVYVTTPATVSLDGSVLGTPQYMQ
jgi:hypothetical protein